MAASSSIVAEIGPRIQFGDSSEINSAIPKLTGTAITMAIAELTSVPTINTSAPYSLVTGSQVEVTRNFQPKVWMACQPSIMREIMMAIKAIATMKAMKPVPLRNKISAKEEPIFFAGFCSEVFWSSDLFATAPDALMSFHFLISYKTNQALQSFFA
ncbi:hypothetical protein THICB6_130152 [Thiomonas arsenitoxydans]|nr:hypothetical protein THICB6_130152 [Thiomonas arsenitoxydans]